MAGAAGTAGSSAGNSAGSSAAGGARSPVPSLSQGAALKLSSLSSTRSPCLCQACGTSRSSSSDQLAPSSRRSSSRSLWAGVRRRAGLEGTGSCSRDVAVGLSAHRPTQGSGQGSSPNLDLDQLTGHLRGQAELGELLLQHGQGHAAAWHPLQLVAPVREPLLLQAFPAGQGMAWPGPSQPHRASCCRAGPVTVLPEQSRAPIPPRSHWPSPEALGEPPLCGQRRDTDGDSDGGVRGFHPAEPQAVSGSPGAVRRGRCPKRHP